VDVDIDEQLSEKSAEGVVSESLGGREDDHAVRSALRHSLQSEGGFDLDLFLVGAGAYLDRAR